MAKHKPYVLRSRVRGKVEQVGAYNTAAELKKAYRKSYAFAGLTAWHRVGDQEIDITDTMPKVVSTLSEYQSAEERDAAIKQNATRFTAVRFLGVGQYERHERATFKEIEKLAVRLSKKHKGNYMLYAVDQLDRSALVNTIIYKRG